MWNVHREHLVHMAKSNDPEIEKLEKLITIRITARELADFRELAKDHKLARRGAVAREVFRQGMKALQGDR